MIHVKLIHDNYRVYSRNGLIYLSLQAFSTEQINIYATVSLEILVLKPASDKCFVLTFCCVFFFVRNASSKMQYCPIDRKEFKESEVGNRSRS